MSIKNWKTDIKIKFPRVHWIRQKHYDNAAESIIAWLIRKSFWLALYGAWSLYYDLAPVVKNLLFKFSL